MAVDVRVLGTVQVRIGGQPVDLGHSRQCCVLAVLLVEANQVVSADQLLDRAWGDKGPSRGRDTLYSYLSRLRQALAGTDEIVIGKRSGGYQLTVDPKAVDLHQFRHLVTAATAAGDQATALELFDQALGLWRGEAFTGLDTPWLNATRDSLATERLAAQFDHTELRLRCGQHSQVLPDLSTWVAQYPLDERLAGQLMLALYRSGRPAEALEHYQQIRARLAEEIGTDPSPPLQRLHQQLLTADPALTLAEPAPPAAPVPRQLPSAPRLFTGRAKELTALDAAVQDAAGGTVVISAIAGAGGIGKTWLAVNWAHRNLDRFPDGQLFVDLRGFAPSGEPMSPQTAMRGFLDAFGVDPQSIPIDFDAQIGRFRSLVAGKRMLIVLDNARDTTQVVPLLPGDPSCTVLVTSRDRLTGLIIGHSARGLPLDVLDQDEARALLVDRLGSQRVEAEPDAVAELLSYCAGLPLALGIVASRAHPTFPLEVFAAELRDTATRLGALDTGDPATSLTTVLSWSYAALEPDQAEVFRLLGLAPGTDLSVNAAAALVGWSGSRTGLVLRALERASLVDQHAPGRYRMHDLVRLYAADEADRAGGGDTALRRLIDFYLHTARGGDRLLNPHRPEVEVPEPVAGCHPVAVADEAAALAWFDAEHPNLLATQRLAAERGWHRLVWLVAWIRDTYHYRRGRLHDDLASWRTALAAADHLDDAGSRTVAHRLLGRAHARLGQHPAALEHLHQALALTEPADDPRSHADTHRALAWAWGKHGDNSRALEHATQALRIFENLNSPVAQAHALNAVGWYTAKLDDYDQARAHCTAALELFRGHGDRNGEAATLDSLAYLAQHTGRYAEAVDNYQKSLVLLRELGHSYSEADIMDRLGQTHTALGNHAEARTAWQQAMELYRDQNRTADADRVRHQLDQA